MKEEREEICLLMVKYRLQCFGDYFVHVRHLEIIMITLNVLQLNQRRSVLHLTLEDTLWYVLKTCCRSRHACYVTKNKVVKIVN